MGYNKDLVAMASATKFQAEMILSVKNMLFW